MFKDTLYTRKLRSSSLKPDLPDVLEQVNEKYFSSMPKPYKVIEESKNQEITKDYNKEELLRMKLKKKKKKKKKIIMLK